MEYIEAPNEYNKKYDQLQCFLAGGITGCPNWQMEVCKRLADNKDMNEGVVVFNPRQSHFDITNPDAAQEQIEWEFKYLSQMDIFSMYFCNSETSNQPICLYELGRYLAEMVRRFPDDYEKRIVISVEDGYSRTQDVLIQSRLALGAVGLVRTGATPETHAMDIASTYYILTHTNPWMEALHS